MGKTIDERVEVLESVAFRHSHHLNMLDAAISQINGKLDDLSGQVREVKLSVHRLGDRVANVEATLTEHTSLLQAILAKLNA